MSATRHSFAQFGCVSFADNARTYQYHRWACANNLYPEECQPDLFDCSCEHEATGPFVSPADDPAPWYDPNDPASTEFLGAMILEVRGASDSTIKREPVDAFSIGTILNRARLAGRSFTFEMLILSTSCRGQDFGEEWLRRVFETDVCLCGPVACDSCFGKQLTLRRSCDEPDPCDTGLRSWVSVGVVDGIKHVEDDGLDECCCVARRVTLVLQSESPYSFGCTDLACSQTADDEGFELCFDWANFCNEECCSEDVKPECDRCKNDLLCGCFALEDPVPQSIDTTNDCYCAPLSRIVQCCCIDDVGAAAYDTALTIEIFSGFDTTGDPDALAFTDLGLRNMRLTIYDNPDSLPCITDAETYEDWCASRPEVRFEIQIPYIPSNATLLIDGRSNRVTMECDGVCRPFPYLIDSTKGSLFPLIATCNPIMVCIEWDSLNTQLRDGPGRGRSTASIFTHRRWLS